jgi:general secretion pathway protein D
MMSVARLPLRVLGLGVLSLTISGCGASALQQARIADDLHDYDRAVAQYTRAVRENPHSRDAQAGLDRAKLQASEAHLLRGRTLFARGRYDDAVVELQLAVELNPLNRTAEDELRAVRAALRAQLAKPAQGPTELESLLARTRDLIPIGHELPDVRLPDSIATGTQTTSRDLYLMLGAQTNVSVTFDADFTEAPAQVSLLRNMTLRQALDAIAASTNTFYRVTGPSTVLVINDTAAKRRDYTDDVERQFILQNADVKETMEMLRVVSDVRFVAPIGSNAIVVRDTPERVQTVGRLLGAIDKARPEIVVEVEVLEVNRARLLEYGIQIATPGSVGIDGSLDANRQGLTLDDVRNLSAADVLVTIPALYYRLIKTDSTTRTLASPHIRIIDGTQATANFGEDVPVVKTQIVPITQSGLSIQPQTSIEYRKVGVNIGITPRTHPNDEVTLNLNIELSNLSGTFQGNPTFGSRTVTTWIRLRDGETSILAGLIRDDLRAERQSIPGFGSVPVLGQLFARNIKERRQTDVVIMLTPHIVRVLSLAEDDLRPLRLPRDSGGSGGDSAPAGPPPIIIRDPGSMPVPSMPPSLPVTPGSPTGLLPTAPLTPPAGTIIKR